MTKRLRNEILAILGFLSLTVASHAETHTTPRTWLHYAPNHNFDSEGKYLPENIGFNLADVKTVQELNSLPPNVKGLAWVGQCDGITSDFLHTVRPFINHARLFGFYLMDNPDPEPRLTAKGYISPCAPEHLRAEADWIHIHSRDAKTFMILMNLRSAKNPRFSAQYAPTVIHVDLYGVDPYPCRTELGGCDYDMVNNYVAAAEASGIPRSQMVPVYQAFGGGSYRDDAGGKYILPSATEEQRLLIRWGSLLPRPVFDYAYSWGSQEHDDALEGARALLPIFAEHNNANPTSK